MSARRLTLAALALSLSAAAHAGEYKFCLLANKVADGALLPTYSDKQIENMLCMTSKEVIDAISARNKFKQDICWEAAGHAMQEFKRRFGNRDPKVVIGRC